MPEVAFVVSRAQAGELRELADTLAFELNLQAVPSSFHVGGFPAQRDDRVYILLDPQAYVAREGVGSLPDERVLKRTVFLCAQPIPFAVDEDHVDLLQRAGAVFVLDPRSRTILNRLAVATRLLRPGYSKSLDHFDDDAPRPIDVAFVETHNGQASHLIATASALSRHECLLDIAETDRGTQSADVGQARQRNLERAKIVICLHQRDDVRFDWRVAVGAIHAGAVVVTQHSSGIAPLVPGEHLLAASADSLPFVADALLSDPQRLTSLRTNAYQRLRSWLPYALPVAVLRAAVVELVGEPLSAAVPANRRG